MSTYFDLPPYRPPSEARSLLIRTTRGCPWNRCAFCGMYKDIKFELRPVEEIKADILAFKKIADAVKALSWQAGYAGKRIEDLALQHNILWLTDNGVQNAFLGDSDSLVMRTDDMAEVIRFLYQTFPTLERLTSYARARTARHKKLEELIKLKEAGLTRLHLGLESGDDEVLAFISKGVTSAQAIEAGKKVKESGISLSEYVILGIGGKDRWQQHADNTARVLNEINPDFIRVRTLIIRHGSPLEEKFLKGEFHPPTPEEILVETRRFVEKLEVTSNFVSDHISNYVDLTGKLPEDKQAFLEKLDILLKAPAEVKARVLRPKDESCI